MLFVQLHKKLWSNCLQNMSWIFLTELKKFMSGQIRSSPDYTIYLCFGQRLSASKPKDSKLILVKVRKADPFKLSYSRFFENRSICAKYISLSLFAEYLQISRKKGFNLSFWYQLEHGSKPRFSECPVDEKGGVWLISLVWRRTLFLRRVDVTSCPVVGFVAYSVFGPGCLETWDWIPTRPWKLKGLGLKWLRNTP